VLATGQLVAASLIMAPVALALEHPWTAQDPGLMIWAAIGGLAVFSTALAYILYFRLLTGAGATNATLVTLLIPVTALLLGANFLGEPITPRALAGMAAIGLGLALIDGRPTTCLLRLFGAATSR
jgi:drug/metabolite transporter (DMT)-like permease